jgi:hypothetical protein
MRLLKDIRNTRRSKMDIRIIDENKIINATNIDIERRGIFIVGLTDKQDIKKIKEYKDEEEAKEAMEFIVECIMNASKNEKNSVIIRI